MNANKWLQNDLVIIYTVMPLSHSTFGAPIDASTTSLHYPLNKYFTCVGVVEYFVKNLEYYCCVSRILSYMTSFFLRRHAKKTFHYHNLYYFKVWVNYVWFSQKGVYRKKKSYLKNLSATHTNYFWKPHEYEYFLKKKKKFCVFYINIYFNEHKWNHVTS